MIGASGEGFENISEMGEGRLRFHGGGKGVEPVQIFRVLYILDY